MSSATTDPRPSDPRHRVRATRTAGRAMRSRLLDAASRLFREKGLAGVSIADIAEAADAFPSQITYYFRTKEALFVEAACRDVLYVGRAAEQHAGKQLSPSAYTKALVESVMGTDAVGFFVESVFSQTDVGDELIGGPGIREVPLPTGLARAHDQSAWLLKCGKMLDERLCLFRCCEAGP